MPDTKSKKGEDPGGSFAVCSSLFAEGWRLLVIGESDACVGLETAHPMRLLFVQM
jgi:hypothetical protein